MFVLYISQSRMAAATQVVEEVSYYTPGGVELPLGLALRLSKAVTLVSSSAAKELAVLGVGHTLGRNPVAPTASGPTLRMTVPMVARLAAAWACEQPSPLAHAQPKQPRGA